MMPSAVRRSPSPRAASLKKGLLKSRMTRPTTRRSPAREGAGESVGDESQLVDGRRDAAPTFLGDLLRTVEVVRDRAHRDAGKIGDIGHLGMRPVCWHSRFTSRCSAWVTLPRFKRFKQGRATVRVPADIADRAVPPSGRVTPQGTLIRINSRRGGEQFPWRCRNHRSASRTWPLLAGVSVGTVSNVVNSSAVVSEATRQRVEDAIAKLGWVRNESARQLRAGRSRSIGMVVMEIANPFFTDIVGGAEDYVHERGYTVQLGNSDQHVSRESAHLELFEEHRVRGVLVAPIREVGDHVARLQRHGIPVVVVDRAADQADCCSVAVDDVEGGRLAVAHLVRPRSSTDRLRGWAEHLAAGARPEPRRAAGRVRSWAVRIGS